MELAGANSLRRPPAAGGRLSSYLLTTNPTAPGTVHSERRPRLEQYYQVYREVAAARGLLLVDLYPTWKKILDEEPDLFKKYVPDGLHPGPLGDSQVIVPGILKAMGL